jgi:RimJ/RimL family protein N-acetyltransferase
VLSGRTLTVGGTPWQRRPAAPSYRPGMADELTELTVRVREVVGSDLPIHFEQQRDPESSTMAAVAPRDRPAFDAHWQKVLADPTVVVRTIVVDDEVAGSVVSFLRGDDRQVGYWVARAHWRKGIATAALALLLETVTERPLYARVAAHNHGSLRVLEKCGFRRVDEELDDGVPVVVLRTP